MASESQPPSVADSVQDLLLGAKQYPQSLLKWCIPPMICMACFGCQSVLLHLTTVKYVNMHTSKSPLSEDLGHVYLGHADVKMSTLDAISGGVLLFFVASAVLLRDMRTWSKLFFCNGLLFLLKGIFDYVTILPDSIGMEACKKRLGDEPLLYFEKMGSLKGQEFISALASLEFYGVGGKWPVRYCADMLLSGHSFVVLLYLLAVADLVQRATMLMEPGYRIFLRVFVGLLALGCTAADLYLIVLNHFHYTVDVIMAIVLTFLLYTNAGIAILTQWFVSDSSGGLRNTEDNGMVWIPTAMFPCCCLDGYYSVKELEESAVIKRQAADQSGLWSKLGSSEARAYGTMQAPLQDRSVDDVEAHAS